MHSLFQWAAQHKSNDDDLTHLAIPKHNIFIKYILQFADYVLLQRNMN
jgi:hypothetical protein